jgi:hypothetical protein
MSEARSQPVPWEEDAHARDRDREVLITRIMRRRRSAEAGSDAVKRPIPRSRRTEPKTPWGFPGAKASRANREHTRCGCAQLVWVAEIGRTYRASSSPGRSRDPLGNEGASREEVRSSDDAEREWAEGETVRVWEDCKPHPSRTVCRCHSLQVHDTMEDVLGLLPVLLSPAGRSRVL